MHGSNAAVSAASSSGNGPSMLQKHHRYSSRSNSISGSSVSTVKRPESLSSSSTGTRTSVLPMRSQAPGDTSLIALRIGESQLAQEHKRRKSVAVEPADHLASEGLANLQRWSHSTNSSVASVGNIRRSRASSGALLPSVAAQHFSPPRKVDRSALEESPRASPQRKPLSSRASSQRRQYSPTPSPDRTRRRTPSQHNALAASLTALPPLTTTQPARDPNDTASPSTIQTNTPSTSGLATPSTHSSYQHDYFGAENVSPRSTAKSKRPVVARNNTAPMSALTHTRLPGSESSQQSTESARRARQSTQLDNLDHGSRPATAMREGESSRHRRESSSHRKSRTRERGEKDKKVMLSKALQKANTAVLLDNAQNFEGALEAYGDACRLLQQVMDRSSGADDKRKLEAIKVTYTNRIEELRQLEDNRPPTRDEKSLPTRPMSDESINFSPTTAAVSPVDESVRDSAVIETATMTKIVDVPKLAHPAKDRESFFSRTMADVERAGRSDAEARIASLKAETAQRQMPKQVESEEEKEEVKPAPIRKHTLKLPSPKDSKYMPAPLSPRRPPSPKLKPAAEEAWQRPAPEPQPLEQKQVSRSRGNSNASVSWLDTIDESGSSCGSSTHSRTSRQGLRRKHIRNTSNETDPDFDAAFDAAVEAAYDEGFEPDMEAKRKRNTVQPIAKNQPISSRKPESLHTRTRTESIMVPSSDIKEVLSPTNDFHPAGSLDAPSGINMDLDDEEEERLLDEITNDYASGFNFDLGTKSALPRQSDSSGYSRSTWQSSQVSDRTTAGTSLSTVAEDALSSVRMSNKPAGTPSSVKTVTADPPPPSAPPPRTSLPRPPSMSANRSSTVRSRRLSGQNAKQLKIETDTRSSSRKRASTFHHSTSPFHEDDEQKQDFEQHAKLGASLEPTMSDTQHEHILQSPPSLNLRSAVSQASIPTTVTTASTDRRLSLDESPGELKSARPNIFRKNKSSMSLREHTVLLSSPDNSEPSVVTPMSSTFTTFRSRHGGQDPLTSQRAHFPPLGPSPMEGQYSGGAYLFDTSLAASQPPRSPRSPISSTQPLGLEPCPESFLLRPFWLMRAIASTLTHQRGGFITTRLFVPREVWQTRGVKLKSIDDKVANCDLLTAALGRLAGVDTFDADAVMLELQNFEEVMERVQAQLVKKLGSDVGVHGASSMFKDAALSASSTAASAQGSDAAPGAERTSKGKEGKSYLNSWRKLRSKSSGAPLAGSSIGKADRELPTMSSVPMTSFVPVERRGQRKDVRTLTFEGPNREYMGSLARLFEGAQILDQIARQVEDPGLKHSSPTHVGLELSIRHAAEFFGFYICRFVLADLGTLIDKFVKRGTEWVLA